jgi:hypothetical protein
MNRIWRISCVGLLVALVLSLASFLPISSSPVLAHDFDPESLGSLFIISYPNNFITPYNNLVLF